MSQVPTKERLARVLDAEGLVLLAVEARGGRFDDYESNSPTPINDLIDFVRLYGREDLAQRAMAGEWDATEEEGRRWFEREGKGMVR